MTSQTPSSTPRIIRQQTLFDRFLTIHCDTLAYSDGHEHDYYTLIPKGDAVNVLAVTPEGDFVLTEEYRHPTRQFLLGCPGGYIDPNETPLQAAERELLEETGFVAEAFEEIGRAFPYPGISSQKIIYLRAKNARPQGRATPEQDEVIRPVVKSEREIREAIAAGVGVDGILCTALYFFSTRQ